MREQVLLNCIGLFRRPAQTYDDKGELVWQMEFDIYGRIRGNLFNNKSFIPFRQLAQYEGVETGCIIIVLDIIILKLVYIH